MSLQKVRRYIVFMLMALIGYGSAPVFAQVSYTKGAARSARKSEKKEKRMNRRRRKSGGRQGLRMLHKEERRERKDDKRRELKIIKTLDK